MNIISDGKEITLNECQVEGLARGKEWLKDRSSLFFCLSGSAGTGKTTLCKALIDGCYGVVVTAPTHKAKKVIEKSTGRKSLTIHKILGLRPDTQVEEFSPNNLLFGAQGEGILHEYKICVIDEASMLNVAIVDLIKERATEWGIKIIFMGDEMQLPDRKSVV